MQVINGYIQNYIVSALSDYFEDLTSNDIQIDHLNGKIEKNYVKLRSDFLDRILQPLFGAPLSFPCQIVQGYIKKFVIEFPPLPFSQLYTKPVELKMEEIHIILKSSDNFDPDFVKRVLFSQKQVKIDQILAEINKQIEGQLQQAQAKDSYFGKLLKVIFENLRINIRNIHIRFEDTKVSRFDQAFNFGIIAESISYSMTNNRFVKAFLNIDDKIQEQKSFSLLLVTKFAMYWNSNAQDNWTKNEVFIKSNAKETIDFSKREIDRLMRRHYIQKQDQNTQNTGVFIIQPCNWSFKFRYNLAPNLRPEIPESTTVWDSSEIVVTIDEEVIKDLQYLTKFFAWHSDSLNKTSYLKFRPAYNCPVHGNAQAYWQYAIKSTIYALRKDKRETQKSLQLKRSNEMIQLAEIYKLEQINKYFQESSRPERQLEGKMCGKFESEQDMKNRRCKLEYKLQPEQIVVSRKQAEKESQIYIEDHKQKNSWGSWVPTSIFTTSYWRGNNKQKEPDSLEVEMQKQLELLVQKQTLIEENHLKIDSKCIKSCFMFQVPSLQLLVVNKLEGFETKCFLSFAIQEFFYQSINQDKSFEQLLNIKSFEISNKLGSPKFQRILYKKSLRLQQQTSQKIQIREAQEIEEESNPNINNGLPLVKNFTEITKNESEQFLLFQLTVTKVNNVERNRIDLYINQTSLFFDRELIARVQTFMHQASIFKEFPDHNFDERLQSLKRYNNVEEQKVQIKSEYEVAWTLKGLEILVPDDSNFDQARFFLFQTGTIILRSQQPYEFQHKLDPYFEDCSKNSLIADLSNSHREEFQFTMFDIQLLYIAQAKQLEQVMQNQISKEDMDRLYSLVRKTDLTILITKILKSEDQQFLWIDSKIDNIDVRTTTKELKEIKLFSDRFQNCNREFQQQVDNDLLSMKFEQIKFETHFREASKKAKQHSQKIQIYRRPSFHKQETIPVSFVNNSQSNAYTCQSNHSESGEDEFFDAQEFWDTEIIQILDTHKAKDKQKIINQIEQTKLTLLFQAQISKLKIQVLEAIITQQDNQIFVDAKQQNIIKGIPFLSFEVLKTGLTFLNETDKQTASFTLKEFCIQNIEKQQSPQIIARSGSYEVDIGDRQDTNQSHVIFDLEAEDNIEINEVLDDHYTEYFIKVFFEKQSKQKIEVEIGLIELEIADFNLRKIIETLVVDWPQSIQTNSSYKRTQQDQVEQLYQINLTMIGFIIKLRVKKDVATMKLLGMHLNIKNEFEIVYEFGLEDFQILYLGDEVVYKYQRESNRIFEFKYCVENDTEQIFVYLSNMLVIIETSSILNMAQNILILQKTVRPYLSFKQAEQHQQQFKQINQVEIIGCFIQIPAGKENKNSLFIEFDNLKICNQESNVQFDLKSFNTFVAKQVDQETKYPLIVFQNIRFDQMNNMTLLECTLIQINFNENFILFLATIADYHFQDAFNLIKFVQAQQDSSIKQVSTPSETFIPLQELEKYAMESPLILSIISMLQVTEKDQNNLPVTSYQRIKISNIEIQWLIGMSFDNHEESFVTLNNRNVTKLILNQLDNLETPLLHQASSQVKQPLKTYEKLVFRVEQISLESAQAKGQYSNLAVHKIQLESSLTSPQQLQNLLLISGKKNNAATITISNNRLELKFAIVDLRICKQNVATISNIVKNTYSCKNVVQRGEKRKLLKVFFQQNQKQQSVDSQMEFFIKIKKVRIVSFENFQLSEKVNTPQRQSPGIIFIDTMTQKAIEKLTITDETSQFKGRSVFVIESGFSMSNEKPNLNDFDDQFDAQSPDSNFKCTFHQLQMYLNSSLISVADLLQWEDRRLMILYPIDIKLEKQFYKLKNLHIAHVSVSMVELELSFKQIFFQVLLANKIQEGLKPIIQILEHMESKAQKEEPQQKQSTMLTLQTGPIFFALIKENSENNVDDYLRNQSMPMLSLEIRYLQLSQKTQPTGLQHIDIAFPLELYYFNQQLSFFEPAIERTLIKFNLQNGIQGEKNIQKIEIEDSLNLNFSVALYENLFLLSDNLKDELTEYQRLLDFQNKENIIGSGVPQSFLQQPEQKRENILFSRSSYFIKNKTGELLMFMAGKKPAFIELEPNDFASLDFQKCQDDEISLRPSNLNETLSSNQELFVGYDFQPHSDAQGTSRQTSTDDDDNTSQSSDERDSTGNLNLFRNGRDSRKPRSPFRRGYFKFKKSEPNRVQIQITIQKGKQYDKFQQFEINFDLLTCQRVYLDEHRKLYVICQTQLKEGQKYLIIRSPMQVTNNLQIPIEVLLLQTTQQEEQIQFKQLLNKPMVVKPGASQIVPLKACNFDSVQIRPMPLEKESMFVLSEPVAIKLLQDEAVIFEQKPIVCHSKFSRNNRNIEKNNKIFFVLNANTYSIRSFIDFNTQQTEFFSLRYLSITPPFTIQNLIPVPITMIFKNIKRDDVSDSHLYDLSFKHNSSLQVLYLNPLSNFDFSVAIPGFEQSNFMPFKLDSDDDFKLATDLLQKNYIEAGFDQNTDSLQNKAQWRFVKQKRLLLQLCSQFQSQFNICLNISFIQGFYHISFYAKYWFLNNTQMPLLAQIGQTGFNFPTLELPYQSTDFDFETVKHFEDKTKIKEIEQRPRTSSLETVQNLIEEIKEPIKEQYLKNLFSSDKNIDSLYQSGSLMMRLKPWEAYKSQQSTLQGGLLVALSQQDIDRVSSIYFTQELIDQEQNDGNESVNNQKQDQPSSTQQESFITANTQMINDDNLLPPNSSRQLAETLASRQSLNKMDKLTKISKTSLQVTNFTQKINEQQAVPLNHTPLSNFDLFPAPLSDKDQLKRVILFSDVPTDTTENQTNSQNTNQQILKLKICNSEWCSLPFDMAKLQSDPIKIKDGQNQSTQKLQPQSLFEIVSVVSYLPQPFSFSKLICFQPRYLMVNRTYQLVNVVQAQCEELGSFKIFPQETSVFHWTDASKPLEICVKVDEHEYSGNMCLDNIGEVNLRLRHSLKNENMILNVSISEETNSFYIVFSDLSYSPPYRIENLTKSKFKIQQTQSRTDDFDVLNPFQTLSFAWSYPLSKKLLKLTLCHMQSEEELGAFNIDSIQKNERINLKDKQNKRNFILEIMNEKTIKVVRIIYPQMLGSEQEKQVETQTSSKVQILKQKLLIHRFGLSIVNSQARELCYISICKLSLSNENTAKHQKVSFTAGDIQVDNQLSRQNDAIILKREGYQRTNDFMSIKFLCIKNQAIENLIYLKYLIIDVVPFELNIDGNFCDESYKYAVDILKLATKYAFKTKQGEIQTFLDQEFDPNTLRSTPLEVNEEKNMRDAINELKKKGKPYLETSRDVQKIYFDQLQINEIRFSFTFSSSPILFREFSMNPTLKFLIVLLSNLKNVKLKFSKFYMQSQHLLMSTFLAQLKRFYWHEVSNHTQILKIVSSMGIFGNLSDTLSSLGSAFKSLLRIPFEQDENYVKALFVGSVVFAKDSVLAISNSLGSILGSLKQGLVFIIQSSLMEDEGVHHHMLIDKDLFEDDIEQSSRSMNNNFSAPLTTINTQNRIWLKIITREKQNYDVKKRLLRKNQQEPNARQQNRLQNQNRSSYLYRFAVLTAQSVIYIPKKLIQGSAGFLNIFLDEDIQRQVQKVRPPRFVSFTMELEPYSKKKAFALEILNEINLNVIEAETIQKLYTMSQTVVIITAKRMICVEEQSNQIPSVVGLPIMPTNTAEGQQQYQSNGGQVYRHWNVFFKDILRVSIDLVDRDKRVPIKDFERILNTEGDNNYMKNFVYFVLKVHFMIDEENSPKNFNNGLFEEIGNSMAGFKVGHHDIKAKTRDYRTIKRILRTLQNKLKQ